MARSAPENGAAATPVKRARWWVHLLLLGALPLAAGILGWGHAASTAPALTHSVPGLLRICAVQLCFFGFVFGLAWLASRASREDLLWRWRGGIWVVPLGIAYSVAVRLAMAAIAIFIAVGLILSQAVRVDEIQRLVWAHRPNIEALVDVSALRHNPAYFWLTIILVSFVVAGLREELWRAGMLAGLKALWPRAFGSRPGQIGAAAIVAVLFGIGHWAQGPIAVVGTGVIGLGFGIIMVAHRSIWPAVIAHGMFDATSFALLPFAAEHLQRLQ
jgi:membrane protease YdiL (CAAX protease family)